jgi:hypothetical protein
MSDDLNRLGQVSATPEGGPIAEGAPAHQPGAGLVQSTPEAAPLSASEDLIPPTWQDHMRGPILGSDGLPLGEERTPTTTPTAPAAAREEMAAAPEGAMSASTQREAAGERGTSARSPQDDEELRKWPPYTGKPVSEVRWEALRYAAPVVAQAEKLTIKAINLSGRGLSKLAQYLEQRRQQRESGDDR